MFEPPPRDRDLSEALVRRVLGEQFPHLQLQQVGLLGSGWEYDVYLIDGHLVVRFPRYADVADDLGQAEALLRLIEAELGSGVTVPRITLRGKAGPLFPHPFFGHELIPGLPASDASVPRSRLLASDLGHALTLIHKISPDRASRVGVGRQKWFCRSSFDALVEVLEGTSEVSSMVPEAAAWVHGNPGLPEEYTGPARFIHDDLQPEHIIVQADSGRLSGIIDWGAALGDPAQDFSFIAAWGGWDFTGSVLESYHGTVDTDFLNRLLFLGLVRALGWLAYEVHMGLDTGRTAGVVRELLSKTGSL